MVHRYKWLSFFVALSLLLSIPACKKDSSSDPVPETEPPITEPDPDPDPDPKPPLLLPETLTCPQELESKSQEEACEITHVSDAKGLYIEGTILTFKQPIANGGLLIDEAGKISCVGCGCKEKGLRS